MEQLRDLIGVPNERAANKDRDRLSEMHRAFLAAAPLCFIATSAPDGTCDVSPKGDPAGSWLVVDDHTLAIPERKGNKRMDGFQNILANPHVGLLFVVPGRGDTLRINGRARLLTGAPYADELVVKGHHPQVIIEVAVEETFFHCSKAFLRSETWKPETWNPEAAPSRPRIARALEWNDAPLEEIEAYYSAPNYAKNLY